MGARITTPYRNDREHLRDRLQLIELRQRLYTLRTRARDWDDDGLAGTDVDMEGARRAEIRRLETSIRTIARRIETKAQLARSNGLQLSTDSLAARYGLCPLEVDILLVLLLEDITVSGGRTYSRGKDILGLLVDDHMSVLDSRRHLYSPSPLVSQGLIVCSSLEEASVLDAYFKIAERAVQELSEGNSSASLHGQLDMVFDEPLQLGDACAVEPRYSLEDVVLPEIVKQEIGHLITLTLNADLLLHSWGFAQAYRREGMTTALFSGVPGTGKTMTAQAVAHALGKRILMVSYPEMVSKWVGDTEKNIVRVFQRAETQDAVLLFDEADAMFHTRVTVSNATDQSFNREVNVLLQEVERFSGVLILTTNRADDLDQAFERRIGVRIRFPMPDAAARERIWRLHVPESAPLSDDVNFAALADAYPFPGGHVRNAVLRAAANAAARDNGEQRITMRDLRLAGDREMATCSTAASGRRLGFTAGRRAS